MKGHTQIHPQLKKLSPLTTQSSSLMCVSTAEHHTTEQYSKTCRTKSLKHLPKSSLSWNTCQDFLKKSYRRCSRNRAKMILKSHLGIKCHFQYNKVFRLLQHSLPIVNAGVWGCIVRDLEAIIALVLLAFNFIHHRSPCYQSGVIGVTD